jgi:acyl-CoA thioesterase
VKEKSIPQRVKALIEKSDRLIELFGMKITSCGAGSSSVSMRVEKNHLNAAGICHGGTIFSLADVAFALASNSHGQIALALDMSISYMRPVNAGEQLTATCRERQRGSRIATYIIEVSDSSHELVALLKATSFIKDSRHFDG